MTLEVGQLFAYNLNDILGLKSTFREVNKEHRVVGLHNESA